MVRNGGPDAADGAIVRDPAGTQLECGVVSCGNASGGAVCPATLDIATLQGPGIVVPTLPANGALTFTLQCVVK